MEEHGDTTDAGATSKGFRIDCPRSLIHAPNRWDTSRRERDTYHKVSKKTRSKRMSSLETHSQRQCECFLHSLTIAPTFAVSVGSTSVTSAVVWPSVHFGISIIRVAALRSACDLPVSKRCTTTKIEDFGVQVPSFHIFNEVFHHLLQMLFFYCDITEQPSAALALKMLICFYSNLFPRSTEGVTLKHARARSLRRCLGGQHRSLRKFPAFHHAYFLTSPQGELTARRSNEFQSLAPNHANLRRNTAKSTLWPRKSKS